MAADADASIPGDVVNDVPDVLLPPPCDLAAAFTAPTPVSGLEQRAISSVRLSADETIAYYAALNVCLEEKCFDLFTARRDAGGAFGSGSIFPEVNSSVASDYFPSLSDDNQVLYFESSRSVTQPEVNDKARIWSANKRNGNPLAAFEVFLQTIFNVSGSESAPYLLPGRQTLYFSSNAPERGAMAGFDIFRAELNGFGGAEKIEPVTSVNTEQSFEGMPVATFDDLTLYFGREKPVAGGARRIWRAARTSVSEPFGAPSLVDELNSDFDDFPTWVSHDHCRLYFISTRPMPTDAGGADSAIIEGHAWFASRPAR